MNRGLEKIQSHFRDARIEDWNNHSVRQKAIQSAAEAAVQSARNKWQADFDSEVRTKTAEALYRLRDEHGIEMPAGLDIVKVALGDVS